MTLEEQLKSEILSRYKSVRAFTTTINVPYSTLDSVFKRGITNAGVSTMIKVFDALDLDIESISSGKLRHRDTEQKECPSTTEAAPGDIYELSPKMTALYTAMNQLNDQGQEKVLEYADDLVSSGKYIKSDSAGLGKEA